MTEIKIKDRNSKVAELIMGRLTWINLINLLAIFDTIYLTYLHFKPSASEVCKISEYFDCDIVNKSIYSELFDVPVAIWGLLTYLLLFIIGRSLKKGHAWTKKIGAKNLLLAMFIIVLGGTAFAGYLTYVEIALLRAICLFCLIQQILIIIELGLLTSCQLALTKARAKGEELGPFI